MTSPTESAAHVTSTADFAPLTMQTHNKLEEALKEKLGTNLARDWLRVLRGGEARLNPFVGKRNPPPHVQSKTVYEAIFFAESLDHSWLFMDLRPPSAT